MPQGIPAIGLTKEFISFLSRINAVNKQKYVLKSKRKIENDISPWRILMKIQKL